MTDDYCIVAVELIVKSRTLVLDAAWMAIQLAERLERSNGWTAAVKEKVLVTFKFNGYTIRVHHDSDPAWIEEAYRKAYGTDRNIPIGPYPV
ncbi:hypothetical protein [Candidatus Nanosynbacter lyticus]|uniref:hypothetical protein n=1 Tax=Candidatus Nanosynbacter lyticus TaxID=2093824 RepID=UPI00138BDEEE|nr:hypothetical protein [Candidatus Nanosynbacter lyticus]QHU93700.1 hypothetical protein GWK78_01455 [Candidatus Saccharibacteria bacterium oral taxon 488]WLD46710.1 hypothetical protein NLML1_0330 [Candidatus Nanosynbacter lyticus]